MKHVQRKLCSAANRMTWRAALQRRAVQIAAVTRTLPSIIAPKLFTRSRAPNGWVVRVPQEGRTPTTVLDIVTRISTRTFDEVRARPVIRVHRSDLVSMARLQELALSGMVNVEVNEARP